MGCLILLKTARLKEIEAMNHTRDDTDGLDGDVVPLERPRRDSLEGDFKMSIERAVTMLGADEFDLYLDEMGTKAAGAIKDPSRGLLGLAASLNKCDKLRILLDTGADINGRDAAGFYAAAHDARDTNFRSGGRIDKPPPRPWLRYRGALWPESRDAVTNLRARHASQY